MNVWYKIPETRCQFLFWSFHFLLFHIQNFLATAIEELPKLLVYILIGRVMWKDVMPFTW